MIVKQPETGISPMKWDEMFGLTAKRDYIRDDLIRFDNTSNGKTGA